MRFLHSVVVAAVLPLSYLAVQGCHGSEEALNAMSNRLSASMRQVDSLRSVNDSLTAAMNKLAQENRLAAAHAAELETQLAQAKEKAPARPAPSTTNPEGTYQHGLDAYRLKEYEEAIAAFQGALTGGIRENLQDNCTYWIGECLYGEKKYDEAIEQFRKVSAFAVSEKKDDAQMMIANSYLALGDKTRARTEYEKLIKVFPASPYVSKAKEKLARF